MAVKHAAVKAPGNTLAAAEWNANHTIDPNTVSHNDLSNVTGDQHHAKQHALDSAADHTGAVTDAQHGVRTLANAHSHADLSNINADVHADTKVRTKVVDEANIADDRILVYKTASGTLVYEDKPAAGIAAGWQKVVDVVLGSNVTAITVNGLDLDAAKAYMIIFMMRNVAAGAGGLSLFFNNDTTVGNYNSQNLAASHATVTGVRYTGNATWIEALTAGGNVIVDAIMRRDVSGFCKIVSNFAQEDGVGIKIRMNAIDYNQTNNVTRIDIVGWDNCIAQNSHIMIFKVTG